MEKKIKIVITQLEAIHRTLPECANKFILKDAIDQLKELSPNIKNCSTCKFISVSKYVEPCYGCQDNNSYDNWKSDYED